MITESEAIRRLQRIAARVDAQLVVDRGSVRYVADSFAGVEYGLRLGQAGALLFVPEGDLTAADWEARVFRHLEAAKRYLEGFPQKSPLTLMTRRVGGRRSTT